MKNTIKSITLQSIKIIIFTSIISTVGGVGIEHIKEKIFILLPLIIMLPALNDTVGNFSATLSSKFTTFLYMGKINEKKCWNSSILKRLLTKILFIAFMLSLYLSILSYLVALVKGFDFNSIFLIKLVIASTATIILLVFILLIVSISVGFHIYKKGKDPDNYLIPITTSIADLGSMILFTLMVLLVF